MKLNNNNDTKNATKYISVVTACYNEEENVETLYRRVREVFAQFPPGKYQYEHIFIDNCSEDETFNILKMLATSDPHLKIIRNSRNFGHIRSPYHALTQATGDAVLLLVADLQDPPELIPEFLQKWEEGFKIVVGVKKNSEESPLFFFVRKMYYLAIDKLSSVKIYRNFTGFGLYDKKIIKIIAGLKDPYPFFRGIIAEIGFKSAQIPYIQPQRKRGFSKNNFYSLYDIGILGIITHSKIPLRIATFGGFAFSLINLFIGFGYLVAKLIFWEKFTLGVAPMLIGGAFTASILLFFIGLLGEYIGVLHTLVLSRPIVIEEERINFENDLRTH